MQRVTEGVSVPVILHVCGRTTNLIPSFVKNDVQGLSLDSDVDLSQLDGRIPEDVAIIGNVSPVDVMLNEDAVGVHRGTTGLLEAMDGRRNFIASTGCDVPPATPTENLAAFVQAVRDYNQR